MNGKFKLINWLINLRGSYNDEWNVHIPVTSQGQYLKILKLPIIILFEFHFPTQSSHKHASSLFHFEVCISKFDDCTQRPCSQSIVETFVFSFVQTAPYRFQLECPQGLPVWRVNIHERRSRSECVECRPRLCHCQGMKGCEANWRPTYMKDGPNRRYLAIKIVRILSKSSHP